MLSLVLPTYNEAKNIPELLPKIQKVLSGIEHEIIVVDDDSPDETWRVAQELSHDEEDIHVIRRIGRRGLSSAVIEGFLAAKGDILAVMDADGQHDTELLTKLNAAIEGGAGVALGSRLAPGGSVGDFDERRYLMTRIATQLAIHLCAVKVADPMSGFFAIKRDLFESVVNNLNPKGFKILLDLLVHIPRSTKVEEIPFTFGSRTHGESKLSPRVQLDFLEYLYDATFGKVIPLTFIKYCIVGGLGVLVHVGVYALAASLLREQGELTLLGFQLSVVIAIESAIIFNFWLNNIWTFKQVRLRGSAAILGFVKYNGACLFGALASYAVSSYLFAFGWTELAAVITGAFTGVIWNYTMSRLFAWKT